MNCLPCLLAEQRTVAATHRYDLTVVKGSVLFCDKHLVTFREFAGRIVVLSLALVALACGGAPFTTLEQATLASGDDAGVRDDSAPADPDAAWWGGVDAKDGGGTPEATTTADVATADAPSDVGAHPGDASADARTDDAHDKDSQADAPADVAIGPADAHAEAAPALCCIGKTQVFTGAACPAMFVVEPYTGTSGVGAGCTSSDCNGTVAVCP
jgi:hypothetical protein